MFEHKDYTNDFPVRPPDECPLCGRTLELNGMCWQCDAGDYIATEEWQNGQESDNGCD